MSCGNEECADCKQFGGDGYTMSMTENIGGQPVVEGYNDCCGDAAQVGGGPNPFNFIINPVTGARMSLFSSGGKAILQNLIRQYKYGGTKTPAQLMEGVKNAVQTAITSLNAANNLYKGLKKEGPDAAQDGGGDILQNAINNSQHAFQLVSSVRLQLGGAEADAAGAESKPECTTIVDKIEKLTEEEITYNVGDLPNLLKFTEKLVEYANVLSTCVTTLIEDRRKAIEDTGAPAPAPAGVTAEGGVTTEGGVTDGPSDALSATTNPAGDATDDPESKTGEVSEEDIVITTDDTDDADAAAARTEGDAAARTGTGTGTGGASGGAPAEMPDAFGKDYFNTEADALKAEW